MTCCSPPNDGVGPGARTEVGAPHRLPPDRPSPDRPSPDRPSLGAFVTLPGGTTVLGEDGPWAYPADGEDVRTVHLEPFDLAQTAVTNSEFAAFVASTGWVTEAERFGWSFVFGGLLPDDFPDTRGVAATPWWRQVFGADWSHPEGPHSDVTARGDHPVVHVGHRDAAAYAAWAGGRLPTEAEWEHAARAGTRTTWPWGDRREPDGVHRMNVFQGDFPSHDTGEDGWIGTCPVDAFEPNDWGLWNQLGNVWEWTADPAAPGTHLLKGGSSLCHESWCRRYRPAARTTVGDESTVGNIGFRIARDR